MLETKLSRMESLLEVQLEKLSENMSSKNFKDDIAKDQIFRKIDSVYERINHKLGYIEGKFDMDALKLQVRHCVYIHFEYHLSCEIYTKFD